MNCRNVLHSLSAYMDGELRGGEHRLVHEHLTRCQECEAEYQELLRMKRLLGRMRMQQPCMELPNRILQRVTEEEHRLTELQPGSWLRRLQIFVREATPSPRPVLLGTGLGIALAFVLSLQVELPDDQPDWHPRDLTQAALLPTDLAPAAAVMGNQQRNWLHYDQPQPTHSGAMPEATPPIYTPVSNMSPYAPMTCEEIDARRGWHRNSQMY